MTPAIAIVGMACEFPDARSPEELWENVLAQRRAFRRIPPERLRAGDYFSPDPSAPDHTYAFEAALIEGYEFDRERFRVAGSTFRSADLSHWLALDVASRALVDAGFPEGHGLPHDTTGVFLGNTLTGEFSRAHLMRLRWPYVRRMVDAALREEGYSAADRWDFLDSLETRYKAPFPTVGEESLAGGMSNTIAGRICNYFDLKGGGYTVDGACASSLLSVANACSALSQGDVDVALAGGVDLSIDPFELVGFAKAGALAVEEMRVFDIRSAGFWPGEGCGFLVLMRYDEAIAQGQRIYAVVQGWGISSDGGGGMTRPELEGQLLALHRAYRRAGFGIETVPYFEGHGTGTSVGDATELRTLSHALREAAARVAPATIGSVKANIGHTKAAAGVAGIIKATMALHHQVLPPTTGCEEPHPEVSREGGEETALRVLPYGEAWPAHRPLRAGVSAMGFGGINTHVVLEKPEAQPRKRSSNQQRRLLASAQDAELFLMGGKDVPDMRGQVAYLLTLAPRLSRSELADLAAALESQLDSQRIRAAVVAATPKELTNGLKGLSSWLAQGVTDRLDLLREVYLGSATATPRIGFLFPGQGSPAPCDGGALRRRFSCVRSLYKRVKGFAHSESVATEVVQPRVITASLAGLRVLDWLGIKADVGIGHSLGELAALTWAGAVDEETVLRIARVRGKAMAALGANGGAMASIGAGETEVIDLIQGDLVVIAGLNSPLQTVISGAGDEVHEVIKRARQQGLTTAKLSVSHAFHSQLVAPAAETLAQQLSLEEFSPLRRTVVSTVTGTPLTPQEDLRTLLYQQVTHPVRFTQALAAARDIDLFIEVGPGQVLSDLVSGSLEVPAIALDAGGPSLRGVLQALGAAFALGVDVNHKFLFEERFTRPFDLNWDPKFFANPCELAPLPEEEAGNGLEWVPEAEESQDVAAPLPALSGDSTTGLVRQLVAERTELPVSVVHDGHRLLRDLHLNSIAVSQLVVQAARKLGLPPPISPTDFSNVTVADLAQALDELVRTGGTDPVPTHASTPSGVDSWVRAFTVELVDRPMSRSRVSAKGVAGPWKVIGPDDHPLIGPLRRAFADLGGNGVVVCLPPRPDESHLGFLLEGARAVMDDQGMTRFVLVQHGQGAASFVRTLHLETPGLATCVVDVPPDHPDSVAWVLAEAQASEGHTEARYDLSGHRRVPVLKLLPMESEVAEIPLGPDDVLLVTGGGKGIAVECALELAWRTGVRLALLGRSQPTADTELAANLERAAATGVEWLYVPADVTDAAAVRAAVAEVETALGPVSAILHAAGVNVPQPIATLEEADSHKTLAPKVQGAHNLLSAVHPDRLRFFITFGSVIARTGFRGEADYAVANEWLTDLTRQWQDEHPDCRCLAIEWSVWSGVGMGARLGRVESMMQQGITPITPDQGVRVFCHLLAQCSKSNDAVLPTSVLVTGRFGETPTLEVARPELPYLRFLECPRVYYPGVELVVDAELSAASDPYLDDHVFRGDRILPAALGLEAMAQAAMALTGASEPPVFRDVKFNRPVVVPENAALTVRVAALVRQSGSVDVVLRSEETNFQVDHFQATCSMGDAPMPVNDGPLLPQDLLDELGSVALDPSSDLYGGILFHRGRFQRLRRYLRLGAKECLAEIKGGGTTDWFAQFLPEVLVLGDPGARDAAIHAVQACIPHATLLPIGVQRVRFGTSRTSGETVVWAKERAREGDTFTYDLEIAGVDGRVQEQWEGLQLQRIDAGHPPDPWPAGLLGPYIERRTQEIMAGAKLAVAVDASPIDDRHSQSELAIHHALGRKVLVHTRPDGQPWVDDDCAVSTSHAGSLTFAVAGRGPIACDAEPVQERPLTLWEDLLGTEGLALARVIAREANEEMAAAATRVWTARECLKKAGAMVNTPLVLSKLTEDGWVALKGGVLAIATVTVPVQGAETGLTVAVLVGVDDARL